MLNDHDALLGVIRHASRRNHTYLLPPGSTLLLYTDGLIEARTCSYDQGIDRVQHILSTNLALSPEQLADLLIEQMPGSYEDDVAVLIVATCTRRRVNPLPLPLAPAVAVGWEMRPTHV